MKLNVAVATAFFLMSSMFFCAPVSAQQQEGVDVMVRAEEEADRLQDRLELEDWQTFYVDSTLKHDLKAIMDEYRTLTESRVSNMSMYQAVQDKWMERIDSTYKTIFTEEQWAEYLKSGAAKTIKAREKRKAKAAQSEGKK